MCLKNSNQFASLKNLNRFEMFKLKITFELQHVKPLQG